MQVKTWCMKSQAAPGIWDGENHAASLNGTKPFLGIEHPDQMCCFSLAQTGRANRPKQGPSAPASATLSTREGFTQTWELWQSFLPCFGCSNHCGLTRATESFPILCLFLCLLLPVLRTLHLPSNSLAVRLHLQLIQIFLKPNPVFSAHCSAPHVTGSAHSISSCCGTSLMSLMKTESKAAALVFQKKHIQSP